MVGCCARAESGHTAAPPLITLMKSRRLNAPPKLRADHSIGLSQGNGKGAKRDLMSASGQWLPITYVRAESALPSTPDLGETSEHVSFVPIPEVRVSFGHQGSVLAIGLVLVAASEA